jgi:hypothetical protein
VGAPDGFADPVPPPPPAAAAPSVPPPPGALATPAPLLAPAARSTRRRRVLALTLLAIVVAVTSGVITYLVRRDDGSPASSDDRVTIETRDSTTTTSTRRTTTSSSSSSTSTTSTTAVPPVGVTPVSGTVARTCGSGGGGDCFLAIRTSPTGSAPEVGRVLEGQPIVVECQVEGEAVGSTVLGRSGTAWDRTPAGTYVAAVFVDAPGFDPLRVTVPCP